MLLFMSHDNISSAYLVVIKIQNADYKGRLIVTCPCDKYTISSFKNSRYPHFWVISVVV